MRDAIENLKGFVGTAGIFNFSQEDHNGLDMSSFEMLTVKDGKFACSNRKPTARPGPFAACISEQLLQYVLAGITAGAIYAIVAIGFNIIYNTTGIINFAQGEFLILGAMTAITLSGFLPLPLAVAAAVAVTMALGALVELVFIRWLASPSVLRLIVITIGVSILMREAMLHVWDEKVRSLPYFTGTAVSSVRILGAHISPQVLWVLGIAGLIVAGLTLFFRYTLTGRAMRACAANRMAARLCGINARRMVTLSFCSAPASAPWPAASSRR